MQRGVIKKEGEVSGRKYPEVVHVTSHPVVSTFMVLPKYPESDTTVLSKVPDIVIRNC